MILQNGLRGIKRIFILTVLVATVAGLAPMERAAARSLPGGLPGGGALSELKAGPDRPLSPARELAKDPLSSVFDPSLGAPQDAFAGCGSTTTIVLAECEALLAIHDAIYPGSTYSDWKSNNDPCTWDGVTCQNKHVTALAIYSTNQAAGSISSSIGALTYLETLVITGKQIAGSLPSALSGLSNLTYLSIWGTQIGDAIPALPANLEYVSLHDNRLTGDLPTALGSLAKLRTLDVSNNPLSGPVPVSLLVAEEPYRNIQNTNLCVPGSTGAAVLEYMVGAYTWCGTSSISGFVADKDGLAIAGAVIRSTSGLLAVSVANGDYSLDNLPKGTYTLYVEKDGYAIPDRQITVEDGTSYTGFVFQAQAIPAGALTTCATAVSINLADCDALLAIHNAIYPGSTYSDWKSNNYPCSWAGVTCTGDRVTSLAIYSTSPDTGSISSSAGALTQLQALRITGSKIAGSLPAVLGNLSNLKYLSIIGTQVSGNLPTELGQLANLETLILPENQLDGTLPEGLGNLAKLKLIDVFNNPMSGRISGPLLQDRTLTSLNIGNTELCIPVDAPSVPWLYLVGSYKKCATYVISGKVAESNGTALAGVSIKVSNDTLAITSLDGTFSSVAVVEGNYTIYPVKTGYTFSPAELTVNVPGTLTGKNFTAIKTSAQSPTAQSPTAQKTATRTPTVQVTATRTPTPSGSSSSTRVSPVLNSPYGLNDGEIFKLSPEILTVVFSGDVLSDESVHSVLYIGNFMLVAAGANDTFDTTVGSAAVCNLNHVPAGDDKNIPLSLITYGYWDLPKATPTPTTGKPARLYIDRAYLPLTDGRYRLYICAASSIWDRNNRRINGGENVQITFTVNSNYNKPGKGSLPFGDILAFYHPSDSSWFH